MMVASESQGKRGPKRRPRRRGDADRDRLVTDNLRLVYRVVNLLMLRRPEVQRLGHEEAVAVGFHTLVEAAGRYDETRPAKFCTYAYVAIWREVVRASLDNNVIRVPPDAGKPGTNWGKPTGHLAEAAAKARGVVRLGACRGGADGDPAEALLADRRAGLTELEDADELDMAIRRAALTDSQEFALRSCLAGATQEAVGRRLGVSKARGGQLVAEAVRRIRATLGLEEWRPPQECRARGGVVERRAKA